MITGLLIISISVLILCCALSIWLQGFYGYLLTVLSLIFSVVAFLLLDASDAVGLSLKGVYACLTILMFFLYVITAKYLMKSKFLEMLTADGFKNYLVENEKYRFPYLVVVFLPYGLVFMFLLYIAAVLLPETISN